ncbi:MAG: carboxypeptidase regulatory-like domain-containing protein [Woeseiaceae bacterium]|nr:carboxypeptidase regulatory-like domain-containing protein [Woeseiaceae bacterium]
MKNKITQFGSGWRLVTSLLFLALALPMAVNAQETTSSIRGKVVDANGSPVADASVVVTNMRNGVSYNYSTSDNGSFFASNLPVGGPYQVAVNEARTVEVPSIRLGDIYNLTVELAEGGAVEEIVVTGQAVQGVDVAAGPAATFSSYDIETSVNFNRDIVDVYSIDPRLNLDNEDDGFQVNCGGKHPRFNSITLDGISQDDRFGLNSNGYSTAVGMPFPFAAIEQVAVELAPFDVTYGGFSACNINAVTKSGSNEWKGNVFYEYTSDSLRGDSIGGLDDDFSTPSFDETKLGFAIGGPIIKDRLFVFAAYEDSDEPRFLARGYAGAGNGEDRPWFSQADHDRVVDIANNIYGYDPGGLPADGAQEAEKYMARIDWNISDQHNLALIYNYFDGFQDRDSDGDSDEFEFANHFYVKGAESETSTIKLFSQWSDAFSTEVFFSTNEMNDSQVTVGPKDFADHQISVGFNTIYLGADDSRQANALNTESDFFKLSGQYLIGDHVITAGYEREKLTIFNQFVQHARGGEYDYFDDSDGNPASCAALTAQQRFDDPTCELSGIDKFELGRPSRIYYGSGGGSNDPADAAALFTNTLNSLYIQDELFFDEYALTLVAGVRYDFFESSDSPNFNQAFTDANGIRNDANIDGLSLLMPRIGFTWGARDDISVRGGVGLYSGGNPNVWISNAWSNDGLTNVQLRLNNFDGAGSVLDGSIPITGSRPGFDVPQTLFDQVAAVTPANAVNQSLVLIDPGYKQPREWKFAIGATYDLPWFDIVADIDYLHSELKDSAIYVDLSQEVVGQTIIGQPIYDFTNGEDNLMLTNSRDDGASDLFSISLRKNFDWGLDLIAGYAYTDGEDIMPMTSSVAGSNFENLATNDINDPGPGVSNYVAPHRLTFHASYANEFFGDNETRITMRAFASEGQPQSYVMGSSDLEGGGFFGRHLLYVPTGPTDPNVVFDPGFDTTEFFNWVNREGLGAGLQERNAQHAGWSNRIDLRMDQEFPAFVGDAKGRVFLKVYNLGNMLNDDWGKQVDAQFFSVQVVNSSVDPVTGQYIFESFSDRSVEDLLESRTLWEVRLGVEIDF